MFVQCSRGSLWPFDPSNPFSTKKNTFGYSSEKQEKILKKSIKFPFFSKNFPQNFLRRKIDLCQIYIFKSIKKDKEKSESCLDAASFEMEIKTEGHLRQVRALPWPKRSQHRGYLKTLNSSTKVKKKNSFGRAVLSPLKKKTILTPHKRTQVTRDIFPPSQQLTSILWGKRLGRGKGKGEIVHRLSFRQLDF